MIEIREFKIENDKWLKININIKYECKPSMGINGWFIDSIAITTKGKFGDSLTRLNDDIEVNKALFLAIQNDSRYVNRFVFDNTNAGVFPIELGAFTSFDIDIDLDGCPCLKDKIFYLKVKSYKYSGTTKCTTCNYKDWIKDVIVDKESMYKKIACTAHKIEDCNIPNHLIDYLMRLKALESSIQVYKNDINDTYSDNINTYYQELLLAPKTNIKFKPCNCRKNG